jgi:hypothetical protein
VHLTWLILTVLVSNFNLIALGLFILAFWKPLEAVAIFTLLLMLIFTGTKTGCLGRLQALGNSSCG